MGVFSDGTGRSHEHPSVGQSLARAVVLDTMGGTLYPLLN